MTRARLVLIVVAVLVVALAFAGGFATGRAGVTADRPAAAPSPGDDPARKAGREFLDKYVEGDGRVVRRDEGGDSVSEGQAYGMLIAVALGDEARFRAIWGWAKANLLRPDGVMAWRWADGRVTDTNSASDADLDAARALVVAGKRFGSSELADEGKQLAGHVLRLETVEVGTPDPPPSAPPGGWVEGSGRMLVAGDWVRTAPFTINPSYFSPRAERDLFDATGDAQWDVVRRIHRDVVWQFLFANLLPPDWAGVNQIGQATPTGSPSGGPVIFGLDAARLPVRFAESCDPADRAVATALRSTLGAPGDVPGLRQLDGAPAAEWQHPLSLVAAAATDLAAGETTSMNMRLDQATALLDKYPTYYGAAWTALGRIMLTTTLLGECPAA